MECIKVLPTYIRNVVLYLLHNVALQLFVLNELAVAFPYCMRLLLLTRRWVVAVANDAVYCHVCSILGRSGPVRTFSQYDLHDIRVVVHSFLRIYNALGPKYT